MMLETGRFVCGIDPTLTGPVHRNTVKIYHSTLSLLGLLRIFSLIFLLIALIPTGNISGRVVTWSHYQVILVTCNEIT